MAIQNSTQLSGHVKDETGNVYGKLTVVEFAGVRSLGAAFWLCRCECGNTTTVIGATLRDGRTKSCGCKSRVKDMTGKRFGRLVVLKLAEIRVQAIWLCRCDCGQLTKVTGSGLRNGGTKSCGCGRKTQGGGYKTPEYTTWKEMKRRCYNPRNSQYHLYGGRGITICNRWRRDFVAFLGDMGNKPFPEATVERIDNDGHYSCGQCEQCKQNTWPANCRWASRLEQGQNTRKVRLLTYNGETMSLRAWARKLGITHCTLSVRIKRGWPPEKVFSPEHYFTPPPIKRPRT